MTNRQLTNWSVFRLFCKILGGQNKTILARCVSEGLLPQLFAMAQRCDLLPAFAVRLGEQDIGRKNAGGDLRPMWEQALRENTLRNMQITAQALKITRILNCAGISPLFLKGTAKLLTAPECVLGFRRQMDIDLIVEPELLEAAGELMLEAGYRFYRIQGVAGNNLAEFNYPSADAATVGHHHLPALAKSGYAATVELHRHFLPKRFQRNIALPPLFSTAIKHSSHGVEFRVASAEYQMAHLILGNFLHDGYFVSRAFPIREACDYLNVLCEAAGEIDEASVAQLCGESYAIFSQLVENFMGFATADSHRDDVNIARRLYLMQHRYNTPAVAKVLDVYARVNHLTHSLVHTPGKLPGFLGRLVAGGPPTVAAHPGTGFPNGR